MKTKSRILLAEDELSLGYLIKDNLVEAGYDVILCPDGQTTIDQFNKEHFDICLLDVMMPNKDGFTKRYSSAKCPNSYSDDHSKIYGRRPDSWI